MVESKKSSTKKSTSTESATDAKNTTNTDNAPDTKKTTDTDKTVDTNKPDSKQENDEQNIKLMSALAYFGILFFLPLVVTPGSKFGKFHANQGLLLLLTGAIFSFVSWILVFIPIIGWLILALAPIFFLILFIMGFVNAFNGKMKRLPLIGGFDLIK